MFPAPSLQQENQTLPKKSIEQITHAILEGEGKNMIGYVS
jgi:hypothetical protein